MKQLWLRLVPTLMVGVLLVLTVAGPLRRPVARADGAATDAYYTNCDRLLHRGRNTAPLQLNPGYGVTQPMNIVGNVSACSVYISPAAYSSGQIEIVEWDPLTLAPDPSTVALRSRAFQGSELAYNHFLETFDPPIVTRQITHLADAPLPTIALDYRNNDNFQYLHYDSTGSASIPQVLMYPPGGIRAPIPGSHPVLSHTFCGGDAALQDLYVTQSVMTSNALLDTSSYQFAQLFSVPVLTRLHWVELAFGTRQYRGPSFDPGVLAIADAGGALVPPASFPTSLVEAFFDQFGSDSPHWESHYDLDHFVTLVPGRNYWLIVRTDHDYQLYSRIVTGKESADFTGHIHGLYSRLTPGASWGAVSARALDFRIIGEPIGLLDAQEAPGAPSGLSLSVSPNPARGTAFVAWSGAIGAVRFEVLDVRGRRVGSGSGAVSAAGRWLWRSVGSDGRALEAGVYFLRAVDDAGHVAAQRVVLIR